MEGAMVSASMGAMKPLLAKLATLLVEEHKLAKGMKNNIASLRDEMDSINAALVKLSGMEEDELDAQHKAWRDQVRELAYDMEDCIDISAHKPGGDGAWLLSQLKALVARHEIASQIEELKARAVQISSSRDRYRLEPSRSAGNVTQAVDPRIEALYKEATSLVGLDGPRDTIVEWLMAEKGAEHIRIVPIVGFGGVGKTTLANQVYTKIKGRFDCTAFVSVSRKPSMVKILTDILLGVGNSSNREYDECQLIENLRNEHRLIEILRDYLKDKRYFIVIDDIWTVKAWNTIKCCFVENNRGSRIITTTRMEDISEACCSTFDDSYVYRIKPLNEFDSRRLFHRRVFHHEDACPGQLKNVSDEILKKCGGVPLAILTVGSILVSYEEVNSTEIWVKVIDYLGFHLERNPASEWMRHVLNLGYSDLSPDLKTCLLYVGVFPEDSSIHKDDLLRRWMAEGFVTEEHGDLVQEQVAESYFNELINRNMIQIAEFDDCGEVLSCRVHDLMLDFIVLKSTEENFITIINDKHSTKGPLAIRRLSLHVRNSESNGNLLNMALTQARSFNLWGSAQWLPSLSKFQLLRVLYLHIYSSKHEQYDTSSICSLFQLRYLKIIGIRCEELLKQLHELQHLKTLDVVSNVDSMSLDARLLPSTLWHLIVPKGVHLVGRIGMLRALRTFHEFSTDDVESMEGLGELINLKDLKLYLTSCEVGETFNVILSSLCKLSSLRSLIINGTLEEDGSFEMYEIEEDVLTHWSPPPCHLRRLHVLECSFSTVPDQWITQLGMLSSLEISVKSLQEDGADVLAKLTSLVHLKLHVQQDAPAEGFFVRRAAFPNLRKFWFRYKVPCLAFEAGGMPRIESLSIVCDPEGAPNTGPVLDGIEHLVGSLVEFKVHFGFHADRPVSSSLTTCSLWEILDSCRASFRRVFTCTVQRKWDTKSMEAAVTKAISKHPGIPSVIISSYY